MSYVAHGVKVNLLSGTSESTQNVIVILVFGKTNASGRGPQMTGGWHAGRF